MSFLNLHGAGDYLVLILFAAGTLAVIGALTPSGVRKLAALGAVVIMAGIALSWTHARKEEAAREVAETDQKIEALEAQVKNREVEIEARKKTIAELQTKIDQLQPEIAKDERAIEATETELDQDLQRETVLQKTIEEKERLLKKEEQR